MGIRDGADHVIIFHAGREGVGVIRRENTGGHSGVGPAAGGRALDIVAGGIGEHVPDQADLSGGGGRDG